MQASLYRSRNGHLAKKGTGPIPAGAHPPGPRRHWVRPSSAASSLPCCPHLPDGETEAHRGVLTCRRPRCQRQGEPASLQTPAQEPHSTSQAPSRLSSQDFPSPQLPGTSVCPSHRAARLAIGDWIFCPFKHFPSFPPEHVSFMIRKHSKWEHGGVEQGHPSLAPPAPH